MARIRRRRSRKMAKCRISNRKKNVLKTVTAVIDEPNTSTVEPNEIEDIDSNSSLSTDEPNKQPISMKTACSKVTVPNITSDEVIDITNFTVENVQTIPHEKTACNIDYDDIIDITDITVTSDTYNNVPTTDRKTALNIDYEDIIDITDLTVTSDTHKDVPTQFSSDVSFNDDVQFIDITPRNQNNGIEIITISDDSDEENIPYQQPIVKPTSFKSLNESLGISKLAELKKILEDSDDSDEENTPNQQSIENPSSLKSINERLGISKLAELKRILEDSDDSDEENTPNQQPIEKPTSLKSINERLGISTTASIKRSYISPLRKRKTRWDDENQPKLNSLVNNLGSFIIDKQKMTNKPIQNHKTVEHNTAKRFKPQVSPSVTTSKTNRKLRPIVIDGLNIGHAHGCGTFSGKGIELCIQFFTNLGHTDVIAFIPQHRQGPPGSESNTILNKLVKKGQICYTPSRKVQNLRMTCYDDRIILNYAHQCGGVVVSNDNYRDLYDENEAFKEIIENRQVMVTFVRDQIIVPEDQYNRRSTVRSLSDILCFPA